MPEALGTLLVPALTSLLAPAVGAFIVFTGLACFEGDGIEDRFIGLLAASTLSPASSLPSLLPFNLEADSTIDVKLKPSSSSPNARSCEAIWDERRVCSEVIL